MAQHWETYSICEYITLKFLKSESASQSSQANQSQIFLIHSSVYESKKLSSKSMLHLKTHN